MLIPTYSDERNKPYQKDKKQLRVQMAKDQQNLRAESKNRHEEVGIFILKLKTYSIRHLSGSVSYAPSL